MWVVPGTAETALCSEPRRPNQWGCILHIDVKEFRKECGLRARAWILVGKISAHLSIICSSL